MSFGIGAFPFGLFASTFNFGDPVVRGIQRFHHTILFTIDFKRETIVCAQVTGRMGRTLPIWKTTAFYRNCFYGWLFFSFSGCWWPKTIYIYIHASFSFPLLVLLLLFLPFQYCVYFDTVCGLSSLFSLFCTTIYCYTVKMAYIQTFFVA